MTSKYDQLTQLKALLDSGALTQEEFDAAKKRILDSDEEPSKQESSKNTLTADGQNNPTRKKMPKWIIAVAVAAVAMVVVIVVTTTGGKDSEEPYDVATDVVEADTLYAVDEYAEEEFGDGLTLGNPWRKDYFKNEWGEQNSDSPFIYTVLDGSGWDIHIDYIPPTEEMRWGLFRFYLLDSDGHLTSSYGPVNILVRGADGETSSIEATGTRDGITFVEDPSEIETLKHYLDEESFDIQLEFEKYNERHKTQAHWDACKGSFEEAKNKLL